MKYCTILCTVLAATIFAGNAQADTIYLKNGVRFDGVVTERSDGIFSIKAGNRTVLYRPKEVARIEKNAKTGKLDKQAVLARWEKRDQQLTEETGLTAEQRRQVKELMYALQNPDEGVRKTTRNKLIALQKEMDVFKFLSIELPQLSHRLSPWVLETLYFLDTNRALPFLLEHTQNTYFGTRKEAITLLGRLQAQDSIPLVARGLNDVSIEVRLATIYALANLDAKIATPAIIACLKHPDLRMSNAGREALGALWKAQLNGENPRTVDEWTAFWSQQKNSYASPIRLENLEPLIAPEEEFENE